MSKLFDWAQAGSCANSQLCLHLDGVGTDSARRKRPAPWVARANLRQADSFIARSLRNLAGMVAGYGTSFRIKTAYAYLVEHYKDGDQVFLFGFSRGAFAVRSLAGFLDEVGLLLKDHIEHVEQAYEIYEQKDPKIYGDLRRFLIKITRKSSKLNEETTLKTHLIGVWDTVGRLGVTQKLQRFPGSSTTYHNTRIPEYATHVRHALALHEVRPTFEPLLWNEGECRKHQSLRQVWFAGAHADVGGGYKETGLSDIALNWMADEAFALGLNVVKVTRTSESVQSIKVNHEIRGPFLVLGPPSVRKALRDAALLRSPMNQSVRVHPSAFERLFQGPVEYSSHPGYVGQKFLEIDRLSAVLAMRVACRMHRLPARHAFLAVGASQKATQETGCQKRVINGSSLQLDEIRRAREQVQKLLGNGAVVLGLDVKTLRRAFLLLAVLNPSIGDDVCRLVLKIIDTPESGDGKRAALNLLLRAVNPRHFDVVGIEAASLLKDMLRVKSAEIEARIALAEINHPT